MKLLFHSLRSKQFGKLDFTFAIENKHLDPNALNSKFHTLKLKTLNTEFNTLNSTL